MHTNNIKIRDSIEIPMACLGENSQYIPKFTTFDGMEKEHFALVFGDIKTETPLVRIHSECMTGDVFESLLCDCGPQLIEAIQKMSQSGGVLIYLRQEGRGIGLNNKISAYKLQKEGIDTFSANRMLGFAEDNRDFSIAAIMLKLLQIFKCNLISNNPNKSKQLQENGIEIETTLSTKTYINKNNFHYLKAKRDHRKHTLEISEI